jgi:hypothetical protein
MISVTIQSEMMVKTRILLFSSWSHIQTLTYDTQLGSVWSISCNIKHFAQQQGQHMIQWSMLRKITYHHTQRANLAKWRSIPYNDVVRGTNVTVACWQIWSKHWDHCAAHDWIESLWHTQARKCSTYAMNREANGLRIIWSKTAHWQESGFKTPRQRRFSSRVNWEMLERENREPEGRI